MKETCRLNKRNRMRKTGRLLCMMLVLTFVFQLYGCQSTKLAEGYDEAVIKETAEEIINDVQMNGAKKVLSERMREDHLEDMDLEVMENTVIGLMKGKGNFMVYSRETVIGKEHPEDKEDYAVILVTATFEKGEVNYTITFDKDMKVVGFYAK